MRVLIFLVMPLVVGGAELARWQPEGRPGGLSLVNGPDAAWKIEAVNGVRVASAVPVNDYYRRSALLLRLEKDAPGPVWLELSYLDRGYGLITVDQVQVLGQHNVARLNTGKVRRALFRIEKPSGPIRVQGLGHLASAAVLDSEPAREAVPEAKAAVSLRRPMDLVVSSGADAAAIEGLPDSLATMRNLMPLVKALGFNGIESYVKWNFVERTPGTFDWSFYDALVAEMEANRLRWFPLLIVGSAYALPEWFFKSPDMVGYRCLEHNLEIEIPTIFSDHQEKYVRKFLARFGAHYGSRDALLGVRLGPSANYGEAQYPATGSWGYKNRGLHTHLGYWAGDAYAVREFRRAMESRYASITALNKAWETNFRSFDEVKTFLPVTAVTPRMRLDFTNWYMQAMTEWCAKWAGWAREAMPNTSIYQSSGGWGAVEIGTDYTAHTKTMAGLKGGIRLTNENDSYLNNVGATRLAASAARFYGSKLGFEPAGFSSVRGVVGRIYNSLTNNSDHLFYYHGNLYSNDQAVDAWLKYAPLLDQRAKPANDIAVFYPDTDNRVNDEVLRHLRASAFFNRIQPLRSVTDYDFVSEQMVLDGALDRFKVLVFVYGAMTEKPVLEAIDRWIARGGVAIYPERQHLRDGGLGTPEGDRSVYARWQAGQTGAGRVIFYRGHPEPVHYYMDFLERELPKLSVLSSATRNALRISKPREVYWSVLETGKLAVLNYDDTAATVRLADGRTLTMPPYSIQLTGTGAARTHSGRAAKR